MPDPEEIRRAHSAAEKLKAEGNVAFQKQKWGAAVDRYTEALLLAPEWPVLLVNRAMCQKHRGRWDEVESDSRRALELESRNMKGNYLLGQALRERSDLTGGIKHLTKALELAREQGHNIKDQIWRELAKARYSKWQIDSTARKVEQECLVERLRQLLQKDLQQSNAQRGEEQLGAQAQCDHDLAALQRMAERASALDRELEPDNAFTCRLTMEVFREPVITPSGLSYEQSALQEHLSKVGNFDPVTRKHMTSRDVTPNLQLRAATEHYLDEHPWAWADVC
ncbi:g12939 [Coccomyxa viridis]|uniref:RING-type E3 ubiquitin transferase n=1 Tax=Coccomyxa viridis TaxID=1274662 RepID=A0ABP1GH51_9CHLO